MGLGEKIASLWPCGAWPIGSWPYFSLSEGSDFSAIAKFLMTEESSWMTGQIIGVDGGRSSIA